MGKRRNKCGDLDPARCSSSTDESKERKENKNGNQTTEQRNG